MGSCLSANHLKISKIELGEDFLHYLQPKISDKDTSIVVFIKLRSIRNLWGDHLSDENCKAGNLRVFVQFKLIPVDEVAGPQLQRSSVVAEDGGTTVTWDPEETFQFVLTDSINYKVLISLMSEQGNNMIPIGDTHYMFDTKKIGALVNNKKNDPGEFQSSRFIKESLSFVSPTKGKKFGEMEIGVNYFTFQQAINTREHVVWEYQRWEPLLKWGSSRPGHFLPSDPGRWQSTNGTMHSDNMEDVVPIIPRNWIVTEDWHTNSTSKDPEGWTYAFSFHSEVWHPVVHAENSYYVRRRRWHKRIVYMASKDQS